MNSASYGRMKIGRCVTSGQTKCSVDVLDLVDSWCTGKRECDFQVANPTFVAKDPCGGLQTYMEASFTCIKVKTPEHQCTSSSPPLFLQDISQHITSHVTDSTQCGSDIAPWIINAKPGQKIKITLIDMGPSSETSRSCNTLGYLVEPKLNTKTSICALKGIRKEDIYVSTGETLHVQIIPETKRDKKGSFLLQYLVIGCSDLVPPANALYERHNDTATIHCQHSDKTWYLRCVNSQWTGVIGNCAEPVLEAEAVQDNTKESKIPRSVFISSIIGVGIVLLSIVLVIGFVCITKSKKHPEIYMAASIKSEPLTNMTNKYSYQSRELPPTPDDLKIRKYAPIKPQLSPTQEEMRMLELNQRTLSRDDVLLPEQRLVNSDSDYSSKSNSPTVTAPVPLPAKKSRQSRQSTDYDYPYEIYNGRRYYVLERAPPENAL